MGGAQARRRTPFENIMSMSTWLRIVLYQFHRHQNEEVSLRHCSTERNYGQLAINPNGMQCFFTCGKHMAKNTKLQMHLSQPRNEISSPILFWLARNDQEMWFILVKSSWNNNKVHLFSFKCVQNLNGARRENLAPCVSDFLNTT